MRVENRTFGPYYWRSLRAKGGYDPLFTVWGNDTFQASVWGLGTGHLPPPRSTIAHNKEDCKKDCGLDLQSHVKKGLQVAMQSILALGLRTWNAILSKRNFMMPAGTELNELAADPTRQAN